MQIQILVYDGFDELDALAPVSLVEAIYQFPPSPGRAPVSEPFVMDNNSIARHIAKLEEVGFRPAESEKTIELIVRYAAGPAAEAALRRSLTARNSYRTIAVSMMRTGDTTRTYRTGVTLSGP
jgi:hypothetical protein